MRSPSLAELMIFAVFLLVPLAAMTAGVVVQRLKTQERLRAIEKGIPFPAAEWASRPPLSGMDRAASFRAAGIVCVAVGLGLIVLFTALAATMSEFPKAVIAVSAVPLFLGAGFLLEYRIRRNETERATRR